MKLFMLLIVTISFSYADITRLLAFIDTLIVNKIENPRWMNNSLFVEHLKKYNHLLHRLQDDIEANVTGASEAVVEDIVNKQHEGINALQVLINNNTLKSHLGLNDKQSVMVWNLVLDINLVTNHIKELKLKQFTKYPEYWIRHKHVDNSSTLFRPVMYFFNFII
ncbi:hypothetical protein J6590_071228 [Homalodisca vitripennis]|nr:hypothetical protein J6590_071228 [Homalodisca vitripennis]